MKTAVPDRTSPVHDALEALGPRWRHVSNMPAVLSFGRYDAERGQAAALGIADASALPRLGIKGPGAADWLHGKGLPAPAAVYDTAPLPGGGSVIRSGRDEVFVEDGLEGAIVPRLEHNLRALPGGGPYEVVRQDASFFVSGAQAASVLAQTCGVDFRRPDGKLVMSRVAGVSAGIRFREDLTVPVLQVWTDPSFGPYLWHTLNEIVGDLGGKPVGLCCFWPELGEENAW